MNKGILVVVSAPSGCGKDTVVAEVLRRMPDKCYLSVSMTTRPMRNGETEGVEYFFVTKDEFTRCIDDGEMLEYAVYCDHRYGTPADYVEMQRNQGFDVVLEIESCGALQVMEKCDDAISIFILPPSIEELRCRLVGRGTEPMDVIEARIAKAVKEIEQKDRYDYSVVNKTVEQATEEIINILK